MSNYFNQDTPNPRAKKSYGQHFLKEEPIAERIAQSLFLASTYPTIIEVGPGMGVLTKYLLKHYEQSHRVHAIEADKDMVAYMSTHYPYFAEQKNITEADFLKVDLTTISQEAFALIGNFPYNISTQILFKALDHKTQIPEIVGMFQREVAERIAATPNGKEYGILSVLMQAFYDAKILFYVKAGSFSPPPKVQSAVIRLERKADQTLGCDEELFRRIVKQTFGQRRKMLRNTLVGFFDKEELATDEFFQRRPETLTVAEFVELTNRVKK